MDIERYSKVIEFIWYMPELLFANEFRHLFDVSDFNEDLASYFAYMHLIISSASGTTIAGLFVYFPDRTFSMYKNDDDRVHTLDKWTEQWEFYLFAS